MRTSASVARDRTFGMMTGRGNGWNQFGRGKPQSYANLWFTCPKNGNLRARSRVG
jgi:hypothetical protein